MRLPLDAKDVFKKRFRVRCECNFHVAKVRCEPTPRNSMHASKPKIFAKKKKKDIVLYLSKNVFSRWRKCNPDDLFSNFFFPMPHEVYFNDGGSLKLTQLKLRRMYMSLWHFHHHARKYIEPSTFSDRSWNYRRGQNQAHWLHHW